MNANLWAIHAAFNLNKKTICTWMKNGFNASFLPADRKQVYIEALDAFMVSQSHPQK